MEKLEQKIGYIFQKKELLCHALTLAHDGKSASYERLEFLGDRVLGLFVADLLLQNHKEENEGEIAKRFTALVREETLAFLARQIELPDCLLTHEQELRNNDSVLADVMEAIIAAIYKDSGLNQVYDVLLPLYTPLLNKDLQPPTDPKTALQEWGHKHHILLPVYQVVSKTGPAHAPIFTVSVELKGYGKAIAEGKSKKIAEQNAASNFLKTIALDLKNDK